MKKSTKNNVRMYDVLQTTLQKHQAAWETNPAMVTGVEKFKSLYAELKTLSLEHESFLTGRATEKKAYLNELIHKTMEMRHALLAFAFETNDYALIDRFKFNESRLKSESQLALRLHLVMVKEAILQHEAALLDYGINSARIQMFIDLFEDFDAKIVSARQGIVERKFITVRIKQLEGELNLVMKRKLDILVRLFKIENPAFFSDYINARIVIEQTQSKAKLPPSDDIDIGVAS